MPVLLPAFFLALSVAAAPPNASTPPNVIVIVTDDQGYGDLGFHGNPVIRTPTLDRFAAESVRLKHFYVSPVCAPTRASLMTGRYNYRTGVVDTYLGRAMMYTDEVTIAEALGGAGYRTGIFGKWHLGDNYPMRPIDQGFEEALVHRGGGLAQPSDPATDQPISRRYFDPLLEHNGKLEQRQGYCTDIFTTAAMDFVQKHAQEPFFVYLAYNCPHTPLQLPDEYLKAYENVSVEPDQFPRTGQPLPKPSLEAAEQTARVYGMVTNIDDNVRRLFGHLESLGIAEKTIVVVLTDNGPQQPRYNAGLRDRKGSVYEGGIRVPCYVRWPGKLVPGRVVEYPAAHIDLLPTLLGLCKVDLPKDRRIDGVDLASLLNGTATTGPERTLCFQWHRGDWPERYRSFAVRGSRFKLVGAPPMRGREETLQLFDLTQDPYEQKDLAGTHPETVSELKSHYERWYESVTADRLGVLPRIVVGVETENPVVLTRQDWRGPNASWDVRGKGYWDLEIARPCRFHYRVRIPAGTKPTQGHLTLGKVSQVIKIEQGPIEGVIDVPAGASRLEIALVEGGVTFGPDSIELHWSRQE